MRFADSVLTRRQTMTALAGAALCPLLSSCGFAGERAIAGLIERARASNQLARGVDALPKGISVNLNERPTATSELKLLGKTVGEATDATDKFLDEAFLNNYDRVRIVHGIGMGALKRAVTGLLTDHPHVAKFYPAPPNEGGNGATVVELKK